MSVYRVPFFDALEDVTGGNAKLQTASYQSVGQFPIVDQGQEFIAGYSDDEELLCHRDGDVIVFGDHTKVFKYIDFDFILGADGVKVLRPKSGFDARYLYHFLQTVRLPQNLGYSRHFKYLKESLVPKPAFEEQQRIAAILDKADSLCCKRQQAIRLADDFLRAVFLDMFGDPVTNPKGWQVRKLGDLCRIRRGGSPRPIANFLGGDIPWIKIGDASGNDSIYVEQTRESIIEAGLAKTVLLEPGAMIFANCGVSLGFARILKIRGCIHDGWLAFDKFSDELDQVFLLQLINLSTKHLRSIAPDGTQPNLNTGIMAGFNVILPPASHQLRFVEMLHRLHALRQKLLTAEEIGASMSSAIQNKYLSDNKP